jgi:hypothetical protein
VPRIQHAQLAMPRPGWLTAGAIRLGLLGLFIVLVEMLRPRLTPERATWLVILGAAGVVAGATVFFLATRRLAARLPFHDRSARVTDAVLQLLRRTGLPLLALAFFLFWAFVYIAVWAVHPHAAFEGLGPRPRFADFFYTSVLTAFISPPGDIVAHSRGARAATMIEMLTAFALVTAYASSFVDWQRPAEPQPDGERTAAS